MRRSGHAFTHYNGYSHTIWLLLVDGCSFQAAAAGNDKPAAAQSKDTGKGLDKAWDELVAAGRSLNLGYGPNAAEPDPQGVAIVLAALREVVQRHPEIWQWEQQDNPSNQG